MGGHEPIDLENKTVIIVDDGIATGNTILAAVKLLRMKKPAKLVVAVPVAPLDSARRMEAYVDDFICCHTPKRFYGVGEFYEDFSDVDEEHVIALLEKANNALEAA